MSLCLVFIFRKFCVFGTKKFMLSFECWSFIQMIVKIFQNSTWEGKAQSHVTLKITLILLCRSPWRLFIQMRSFWNSWSHTFKFGTFWYPTIFVASIFVALGKMMKMNIWVDFLITFVKNFPMFYQAFDWTWFISSNCVLTR